MTEELANDHQGVQPQPPKRVAYLLGAGATQGSVSFAGSQISLLMAGLRDDLTAKMRDLSEGGGNPLLREFVNDVATGETDFEQLTTFLEDAPSVTHRDLAGQLKELFRAVLQTRLEATKAAVGDSYSALYAALVDMYQVEGRRE